MKLPDLKEFINVWPSSLGILKEKVLAYFKINNIQIDNVWFPDIEVIFPFSLNNKSKIQVVLFGGFLERIFESGNWPDKEFTFWCLSSKVKKILIEVLDFPINSIRTIDRQSLFNKPQNPIDLDLDKISQIYYSGRLSSQKNIEMFLAFTSEFQKKVSREIEVTLFGDWDNHAPKNRGRYIIDSYQDAVVSFQKKLEFSSPPKFIHSLSHYEWPSQIKGNAMMANFSTFVCEDFGVSVAQSQELGIPMILSKWGGHCDVNAINSHWVDIDDIGESFSFEDKIVLKAKSVVNKLFDKKLEKTISEISSASIVEYSFVDIYILQKMRIKAMEKIGNEISFMGQDRMSLFASTTSGKDFFKIFSNVFSGKS